MITFLSLFCSSAMAYDALDKKNDPQERVYELENRVHEIWKMDFAEMKNIEKQALRNEVKSIRKEIKSVKSLDDKITISVGLVIIILLLLILLSQ